MSTGTRRSIAAVLVAGLAIGGAVALTSSSASGVAIPPGDDLDYNATVTIELTDRTGKVVLAEENAGGAANVIEEEIQTGQPCAAIQPLSGSLLQFVANGGTSSSDTVQINNSAIGILTDNTACGNANAGTINRQEFLTIGLAPGLAAQGVVAESVTLNVDRFQRGDLKVGYDGGDLELVQLGDGPGQLSGYPGTVVLTPGFPFTSITVSSNATNNAGVSVLDGTSFTLASEFDQAVDCNEQVEAAPGAYAESARFVRAVNDTDNDYESNVCDEVGVIIEILQDRIFWDNGTTDVNNNTPQDVVGEVTIDFTPIAPAAAAALEREIDFDANDTAFDFRPLLWCDSYEKTVTGSGTTISILIDVLQPTYPDGTVATWCKVQDIRMLDGGLISQTVVVVGGGDPWLR